MRKIYLFLAMLLAVGTLQVKAETVIDEIGAAITNVSDFQDGGTYILFNIGRSNYLYEDASTKQMLMGAVPTPETIEGMAYVLTLTKNTDDTWIFKTNSGNYIPLLGNTTNVYSSGTADKFTFAPSTGNVVGAWIIQGTNGLYFNANPSSFTGYTDTGANSNYGIYPVTLKNLTFVDVTYNYQLNGVTQRSETVKVVSGTSYTSKAAPAYFPCETTYTPTTETITANKTIDINYTLSSSPMPFVPTTVTDGQFASDTQWYTMTLRGKYANFNGTNLLTTSTTEPNPVQASNLFAFTGNPVAGFKIYNLEAGGSKILWSQEVADNGMLIPMTDASSVTDNGTWILSVNGDGYGFKKEGTSNGYINERSGGFSYWVSSWAATDAGSKIVFAISDYDELADLKARANAMIDGYIAANAGLVGNLTDTDKAALEALLGNESATLADYETAVATAEANMKKPQAGKYYRIENVMTFDDSQTKAIYENTDGTNIAWKSADTSSVPMLWQFVDNGDGTYKIVSANTQKQISSGSWTTRFTMVDEGANFTLTSKAACVYGIQGDDCTLALFSSDGDGATTNSSLASGDYVGSYNGFGDAIPTTWKIREISAIDIAISSVGYATTCLPFAVEIPSGVTASQITATDDEKTEATETSLEATVLAKETPVLLSGAAATYTFNISTAAGTGSVSGNMLQGVLPSSAVDAETNAYILGAAEDGTAKFFLLDAEERTLPANRAYLVVDSSAPAKSYTIGLNTTGIDNVAVDETEGANVYYDLAGRRVSKPTKGLYIVNGKKVIIK